MSSAMGAGGGADMLQEILKRKFTEAIQKQHLAEQIRRADMQNAVQHRQLGQGDQRIAHDTAQLGETQRQFNEQAPVRLANVAQSQASTAALNRQPEEAEKGRTFTAGQNDANRTFQGGQGDLNRSNAVRLANIHGANSLAVANVRHPDQNSAAASEEKQNEIQDSIDLIKQIRDDKARATSTGPIQGRGAGALWGLEGFERVKALHDNLVNKMSLAQSGKLKGQGPVSNFERDMLAKAATALKMQLGDDDYLTQLDNVDQFFKRQQPGPRAAPGGGGGGGFRVIEEVK